MDIKVDLECTNCGWCGKIGFVIDFGIIYPECPQCKEDSLRKKDE